MRRYYEFSAVVAKAVLAAKPLGEPYSELLPEYIKLGGSDIYLSMWYKPNDCVLTV